MLTVNQTDVKGMKYNFFIFYFLWHPPFQYSNNSSCCMKALRVTVLKGWKSLASVSKELHTKTHFLAASVPK